MEPDSGSPMGHSTTATSEGEVARPVAVPGPVAIPWLEISLTHAAIAGQALGDLKEFLLPFDEDLKLFPQYFFAA